MAGVLAVLFFSSPKLETALDRVVRRDSSAAAPDSRELTYVES